MSGAMQGMAQTMNGGAGLFAGLNNPSGSAKQWNPAASRAPSVPQSSTSPNYQPQSPASYMTGAIPGVPTTPGTVTPDDPTKQQSLMSLLFRGY